MPPFGHKRRSVNGERRGGVYLNFLERSLDGRRDMICTTEPRYDVDKGVGNACENLPSPIFLAECRCLEC